MVADASDSKYRSDFEIKGMHQDGILMNEY